MPDPTPKLKLRATWHTLALLTMLAAMWYAAEAQSNGAAYLLALLAGVLAAVSTMHARANLRGLRLRVRAAATAREGTRSRVRVEMMNIAAKPACGIEVLIAGAEKSVFLHLLDAGETRHLELLAPPQHRAGASLRVVARSVYPLGLYSVESVIETAGARRVHPKPAGNLPLPAAQPLSRQAELQAGSRGGTTNARGGDDFAGTREWQQGDSPRHIDWRAVARGRPLVVKTWSAAANGAVSIDWNSMPLPKPARAGQIARWIELCEQDGQPFELKLPDSTIPAGTGEAHARLCLDALSDFIAAHADLATGTDSTGGGTAKPARRAAAASFENASHLPGGPLLLLCAALAACFMPLAGVVALPCVIIAALCLVWRGVMRMPVPHLMTRLLVLVAGVVTTWLAHTTLRSMEAGMALLITLAGAKLLESRSPREFQILALIGWFMCLCGIVLDNSLPRMLWCAAAFALVTMCLVRFRHSVPGLRRPAWLTGVLFAQSLPLVALLFLVFPRGLLNLSATFGSQLGETGISNELDPGGITRMALRMERAFRVEFPHGKMPVNEQRYWRCITLWDCYGLRWRHGERLGYKQRLVAPQRGRDTAQLITLEPHGMRWLPALDIPLTAESGGAQLLPEFDDTFVSPFSIRGHTRYTAWSRIEQPPFVELPEHHREAALQLPANLPASMRALAASWEKDAPDNREIMLRGLNHLRTQGFKYTLTPDDYSGPDGFEKFMTHGRNGFCEHFSASFATLMRMAGVPARIVIGFLGGEYSLDKGQMIVRQSDAHAWVEVWVENFGWQRVDPTAALAPDRVGGDMRAFLASGGTTSSERGLSWWSRAVFETRVLWDRLNYAWQDRVVEFDQDSQRSWFMRLGWETGTWWHLLAISGGVLVLGLLILALWLRRRARHPDPWARAWLRLCQKLAKAGYPTRQASEGPLAYIQRIATGDRELHALAETYATARYGPDNAPASEFLSRIHHLRLTRHDDMT